MRKEGPCFHCGTDSTPLWRNGPPEKPVLCNACGSRHRLGKSLQNYIPKHGLTMKDTRIAIPQTPHNEAPLKTQENVSNNIYYSAGNSEDNKSNNSSSDSGTPSLQINQENGTENSGSKKTKLWIPHVPSRKRSSVTYHRLSTIEQLQRDLYNVLIYQGPSILSESADDILLYNVKNNLIASTEIGLGSTLFIPPATSMEKEIGPQLQLPEEWRSD